MNKRTVVLFVAGAAALLAGGALLIGTQQPRLAGADARSAAAATPSAVGTPGAPSNGTASTAPADPAPGASAPSPGTPVHEPSTEVLPLPSSSPLSLPPSTPLPDLVTSPLPATASATGKIVRGFPSTLLSTAPESQVVSSSVAAEGSHLQASLAATSTLSADEVLLYYRTAFAPFGLLDSAAPATSGSSALVFTRGADTVTLTVTGDAGGTGYVIFGALTASH